MHVAIAGYGDLAHYLREEFLLAGHTILILTRAHKPHLDSERITQSVTDYTVESLSALLEGCNAVISTISEISSAYTDVHVNLLQACRQSKTCKRFIPAEFAGNIEDHPDQPRFYYGPHEPMREMLRNQNEIEWTLVCIGWLADYFVPSKNRYIKDIGEYHPMNWSGDRIIIPGTGNEPVDFTWARDVARGLVSLLDVPLGSWEPYTFMSGERSCWNDALHLAKKDFCPDAPQEYVPVDAVRETIETARDESAIMFAEYCMLSISNACAGSQEKIQKNRKKFFPEIHFRTLKEGLSELEAKPNSIL